MPKKKTIEKDLFGYPLKKRKTRLEAALEKNDQDTFTQRLERLKFVEGVTKNLGIMGDIETVFIFKEAGWAYINGAFISTIMLSQAFIERRLQDLMIEKGLAVEANRGSQEIIKYCRKHQLMSNFLLNKCERLRQKRNPFAHSKPFNHPFNIGQRTLFERIPPHEIVEKDAKEALSLMYTLIFTHL